MALLLALQTPPALPFVATPARLQHVRQRPGLPAGARRAQQPLVCGVRACEERRVVRWLLGLSSAALLGSVTLPEDAVAFYQPTRTSLDAALSAPRPGRGEDECPHVNSRYLLASFGVCARVCPCVPLTCRCFQQVATAAYGWRLACARRRTRQHLSRGGPGTRGRGLPWRLRRSGHRNGCLPRRLQGVGGPDRGRRRCGGAARSPAHDLAQEPGRNQHAGKHGPRLRCVRPQHTRRPSCRHAQG